MNYQAGRKILIFIALFITLSAFSSYAYATEGDLPQLQHKLESAPQDSTKVNAMMDLVNYYLAKETKDLVKALKYANQAATLSESLDFKRGKYVSYTSLVKIYELKGNLYYPQQIKYEKKAKIAKDEYYKYAEREKIKKLQDEKALTEAQLEEQRRVAEEQARIAEESELAAKEQGVKINEMSANNMRNRLDLIKKDSLLSAKDTLLYLKTLEAVNNANELQLSVQEKELQKKEIESEKAQKTLYFVLAGSAGVLSILMFFLFRVSRSNAKKLGVEKKRSDDLLLNILPSEVANELKAFGKAKAQQFEMVTVMFTDFKGFTQISEKMAPEDLVNEIDFCFAEFDKIVSRHNIEKIKTIGDSYLCVGGLPKANTENPLNVVQAAIEIRDFMVALKKERDKAGEICFEIRIGIHSGPVVAGIVGIKKFAYDIWGDTVNTASRMESSGEEGRVNISGFTYEHVKHDFLCQYRGKIDAKNKGQIDMYFVESLKPVE